MNTKTIGDISTANFLARALEKDYAVSVPFGDRQRYDLILDDGNKLLRVQVKTARFKKEGVLTFDTCSVISKAKDVITHQHYLGQIDAFGVYAPLLKTTYLVPIGEGGLRECHLRITKPKWEVAGTRYAKDFEF